MRKLLHGLIVFAALLLMALSSAQSNPCSVISLGQGGSLNGFAPFPSNSLWNTNIANAPVDPNSGAIINFIGSTTPLHPDFGSGQYQGQTIGIPYLVVAPSVGAIRGTSVTVNPNGTTTYTLYATNQYGRSTATVKVNVP